MLRDHAGELEADFQQYYGLDMRKLLEAGEFRRAEVLARQLPASSRTARAVEPRLEWDVGDYLLALVVDNLAFMRYEQTAGARRARKPKPLKRPGAGARRAARTDERTVHGMSAEAVGEILSRPRG